MSPMTVVLMGMCFDNGGCPKTIRKFGKRYPLLYVSGPLFTLQLL